MNSRIHGEERWRTTVDRPLTSSELYNEEEMARSRLKISLRSLIKDLNGKISEVSSKLSEAQRKREEVSESKISFLRQAESAVESELHDKSFDIERYSDALLHIQNDLKSQLSGVAQELNTSFGPSESFLEIASRKFNKTSDLFDKETTPEIKLDLEVVSQSYLNKLKEELFMTNERLKHSQMKKDNLYPHDKEIFVKDNSDKIDALDRFLSRKMDFIQEELHAYNVSRVSSSNWTSFKASLSMPNLESPPGDYRAVDNLERLRQGIFSTLKIQEERLHYKEQISTMTTKQELTSKDTEFFMKKIRFLEDENAKLSEEIEQNKEKSSISPAIMDSINDRTRIAQLEEEIKTKNQKHERELENVRKIYNDKYEELMKTTSAQLNELEGRNTDDGVYKKIESLVGLIEHSKSSPELLLAKVKTDLELMINHTSLRDSLSYSQSFRPATICKRCNQPTSNKYCVFHPFLVYFGLGDLLYSDEWHKCREGKHTSATEGCFTYAEHYYGQDSLIKIEESFSPSSSAFDKPLKLEMNLEDIL